jgi:hypothetical protein
VAVLNGVAGCCSGYWRAVSTTKVAKSSPATCLAATAMV